MDKWLKLARAANIIGLVLLLADLAFTIHYVINMDSTDIGQFQIVLLLILSITALITILLLAINAVLSRIVLVLYKQNDHQRKMILRLTHFIEI